MSTKSVIAVFALAIFYASAAQLALARERVSASSTKHHSLVEHCDPQDGGSPSSSSDFVDIPYTFGSTLEYRPAWTGEAQTHTNNGQNWIKKHTALSPAHHC